MVQCVFFHGYLWMKEKDPEAETRNPAVLAWFCQIFFPSNGFKGGHRWESHSQPFSPHMFRLQD